MVALLAARSAWLARPGTFALLLGVAVIGGWLALLVLVRRRTRGLTAQPPQPGRRTVIGCALITAAYALLGAILTLS